MTTLYVSLSFNAVLVVVVTWKTIRLELMRIDRDKYRGTFVPCGAPGCAVCYPKAGA